MSDEEPLGLTAAEIRLHMGEMTAQEMRTARAAIRLACQRITERAEREAERYVYLGAETPESRALRVFAAKLRAEPTPAPAATSSRASREG